MKKDTINYLAVGSFVLSMLILLLVVILRITGHGGGANPYYLLYPDISGIDVGSTVTDGGYPIGHVSSITPRREGGKTRYRLELAIKMGWKIPADSVARIVSTELLGDNVIDIQEGESALYLSPGDTIKGAPAINPMALLNSVVYDINDLAGKQIKPLLENINHYVEQLGKNLDTNIPDINARIIRLLERFQESADQLSTLLSDENQAHLASLFRNADEISLSMKNLTGGLDKTSSQLDLLLRNLSETLEVNRGDAHRSVIELRKAVESVSQNIDTIVYNLETTTRNFTEFSRQLRENPGVLLTGRPPRDEGVAP